MTNSENESGVSDAQLENLLRRFFAEEIPVELRAQKETSALEGSSGQRHALALSGKPTWRRVTVATAALCMASVAFWYLRGLDRHREMEPLAPELHQVSDGEVAPVLTGARTVPAGYSLSQQVQPVESQRYDTTHGVVEQRTNLSTTNVLIIEPESGDLLELTLPELTIEVFPIEDDIAPGTEELRKDDPKRDQSEDAVPEAPEPLER